DYYCGAWDDSLSALF
nr:immunoglobulin light chain junction region [Macaca mulatta]MOX42077.1 immunoglobulin light chain junction region [Macaca mulatta]MOX42203.1 immunoglobulin light chain junction region [Macaca mulatta]MOX42286.1 immunoglobulin light chain junction region [Macaca mulatta]MOX42379.1 immunoglobulin light chain junction region [Macaca mulatta]